jgi:hypothetical protein
MLNYYDRHRRIDRSLWKLLAKTDHLRESALETQGSGHKLILFLKI